MRIIIGIIKSGKNSKKYSKATLQKKIEDNGQGDESKVEDEDSTVDFNGFQININKTANENSFDILGIKRYCSRRHLLSHIDLVDMI